MSTADTGTRGSRPGDLPRRRVLLLAESAGLAAVLHHLLDPGDRLSRLGTLRELAETRALENADVVILDVPADDRPGAVRQVRRRYLGPLVVLVAKGDDTRGLQLDDRATLLTRPFSAETLGTALGHPGGLRPTRRAEVRPAARSAEPAAAQPPSAGTRLSPPAAAAVGPGAALAGASATTPGTPSAPAAPAAAPPADAAKVLADVKAAARQAPVRAVPATPPGRLDLVDRVQRALVALTQGWKARRRVRVAGFSAFALVAFTVAFAMASQGRCGPGCDAFGTAFSPAPTIAASQSTTPSTTGTQRSTSTTAARAAGSPGTGAFRGISGGRLATTTTERATTTTRRPVATTRPATTRPPATTKPTTPPTTAPPTTAPPTTLPPPTTAGA